MSSLTLHQNIVQKFHEEYLAAVSPIVEQASPVSLAQRWDVLFQCSIAPKPEWMAPDSLAAMLDLYQVPSHEHLMPKYLGDDFHWGAIVSPRVATTTGEPIAFIEHWFVTDPGDLDHVVEAVKTQWPFPYSAIWIPMAPRHRCAPFINELESVNLKECAYVADWGRARPEVSSATKLSSFSCATNQALDSWGPDFCHVLKQGRAALIPERERASLRKRIESCLQTGGIVNLHDDQGLAAHVSWCQGSEAELLIPQCWNVPYIFVRHDLRGQGLAKHMYALAAQNMGLDEIPLICARVQEDNLPSVRALEAVGAERVLEYYTVG